MKKLIIARIPLQHVLTFIFLMTGSVTATTIDYTTESHWFKRWPDQMQIITSDHEEKLERYLGKTLECRLVQLTFNNLRSPTIFRDGKYNLTLSAECNKSFSNFNIEVTWYGYSLGEPLGLKLSYVLNNRFYEETIQYENRED